MDAARDYARRGFNPTPLIGGEKAARIAAWQATRITPEDLERIFEPGDGVGLVLGELSGNVVCVDKDSPESVLLGDEFLPPTDMVQGRPSKPTSHLFYRLAGELPPPRSFKSAKTGSVHVDIRASGHQVVVAPSRHPSGEPWQRVRDGEPGQVTADQLLQSVAVEAAVAELLVIWPKGDRTGIRHEATLALTGALLRAGLDSRDHRAHRRAALSAQWRRREHGPAQRRAQHGRQV